MEGADTWLCGAAFKVWILLELAKVVTGAGLQWAARAAA